MGAIVNSRAVAAFLLIAVVSSCSVVPAFTKATGSAAVVVSGAYRALDKVDTEKMTAISALAKAGKPDEAKAALDSWLPKYNAARKAVDAASAAVETAVATLPAIKLGTSSAKRDAMQWIATMIKLTADVVKACADIGLKIPGVQL